MISQPQTSDATETTAVPVPAWERPGTLLLMAAWFGLLSGTVQAIALFIIYKLDRCILDFMSPYIWTIPLSEAAALLIPGLIFFYRARRRGLTLRLRKIALFFFVTVSVSTIIFSICSLLIVKLFPPAAIILAAGVATQVVRFAVPRPRPMHQFFRRTIPIIVGLALLAGIVTEVHYAMVSRRLFKRLPAAAPNSPNLLLVVLDTVRAKSMSLYGNTNDTTPNLVRWAKRGVTFDQAVSPSPYTLAAHASMFTGRYPHELATDFSVPLESTVPVLAQVLHDHGYFTAGFVANTWNAGRQTGLDRGFIHYSAHHLGISEILIRSALLRIMRPPRSMPPAWAINEQFTHWLDRVSNRPYFAFLNYSDCHTPYQPEPQDLALSPRERREVFMWGVMSPLAPHPESDFVRLDLMRDAYDACLHSLDRRISALLQSLEARDDLKNTYVVIVGDHGEQFGEHNLIQHADSLYRPALHVPLVILGPGKVVAGQRVHQLVNLRDLPASLLDLLGLPHDTIGGTSFAAVITNSPPPELPSEPTLAYVTQGINFPTWHPNADGPVGAVFLDGKYLIRNAIHEELYDFESDPEEKNNLIESTNHTALLNRMRPLLPSRARK